MHSHTYKCRQNNISIITPLTNTIEWKEFAKKYKSSSMISNAFDRPRKMPIVWLLLTRSETTVCCKLPLNHMNTKYVNHEIKHSPHNDQVSSEIYVIMMYLPAVFHWILSHSNLFEREELSGYRKWWYLLKWRKMNKNVNCMQNSKDM